MILSKDDRINTLNIALMILSCMMAFVMPFEVFLFAYAILGPLHYLTEISWLHDRQYFTKGKYDYWILWFIGGIIMLNKLALRFQWNMPFNSQFANKVMFLALTGSLLLVFVKNGLYKILGLLFIIMMSNVLFKPDKREGLTYFIAVLLPTLIHVYVFTGFFLLNGALKTRSKTGIWAVLVFAICPILLFNLFQDSSFVSVTQYGMDSFRANGDGFFHNNISYLKELFGITFQQDKDAAGNLLFYADTLKPAIDYDKASFFIFHSKLGILLMRFIAFAYTYHYLNWFSKTQVIKWHKVPKIRFVVVIVIWIASITLYAYNYSVGIRWLYFLSFCHVLLEFPLNILTITSIGKELFIIVKNGFTMNTLKTSK